MKLREVRDIIDAEVIVGEDDLDLDIKTAFDSDLLSDVLAFAQSGCLLLTGLTNTQVIQTANLMDMPAVILVRGKKPSAEMISLAKELKIPILSTKYIMFETTGRLYTQGICGCLQKVDTNKRIS